MALRNNKNSIIGGADPDNSILELSWDQCASVVLANKQDRLIEHFVSRSTALTAANLCGVNRKMAAYFPLRLREIIALDLVLFPLNLKPFGS